MLGNFNSTKKAVQVLKDMPGFDDMIAKYPVGTEIVPYNDFGKLHYEFRYKRLLLGDTTGYRISAPVYENGKFDVSDSTVRDWLKNNNCSNPKEVAQNFGLGDEF